MSERLIKLSCTLHTGPQRRVDVRPVCFQLPKKRFDRPLSIGKLDLQSRAPRALDKLPGIGTAWHCHVSCIQLVQEKWRLESWLAATSSCVSTLGCFWNGTWKRHDAHPSFDLQTRPVERPGPHDPSWITEYRTSWVSYHLWKLMETPHGGCHFSDLFGHMYHAIHDVWKFCHLLHETTNCCLSRTYDAATSISHFGPLGWPSVVIGLNSVC